ncbi:hypothetical protein FW774_14140 [Pedobacter sp. BS3]|nr:hypothetical protein FW774_14140 [Pedobacter sp. BS3]
MRQILFTGWNFMRWLRLGAGIFFAVEALKTHDKLFGFAAAFFLFTAHFNTGCCGPAGCAVPGRKIREEKMKDDPV